MSAAKLERGKRTQAVKAPEEKSPLDSPFVKRLLEGSGPKITVKDAEGKDSVVTVTSAKTFDGALKGAVHAKLAEMEEVAREEISSLHADYELKMRVVRGEEVDAAHLEAQAQISAHQDTLTALEANAWLFDADAPIGGYAPVDSTFDSRIQGLIAGISEKVDEKGRKETARSRIAPIVERATEKVKTLKAEVDGIENGIKVAKAAMGIIEQRTREIFIELDVTGEALEGMVNAELESDATYMGHTSDLAKLNESLETKTQEHNAAEATLNSMAGHDGMGKFTEQTGHLDSAISELRMAITGEANKFKRDLESSIQGLGETLESVKTEALRTAEAIKLDIERVGAELERTVMGLAQGVIDLLFSTVFGRQQ